MKATIKLEKEEVYAILAKELKQSKKLECNTGRMSIKANSNGDFHIEIETEIP